MLFHNLINEAFKEILLENKTIEEIKQAQTPVERLYKWSKLSPEIQQTVYINPKGELVNKDQYHITVGLESYKKLNKIISYIDRFNHLPDNDQTLDEKNKLLSLIPTGKSKSDTFAGINFRLLLNKEATDNFIKDCVDKVTSLIKRIIGLENVSAINKIAQKEASALADYDTSNKSKYNLLGTNKYLANFNDKLLQSFVRLIKTYSEGNVPNNPYIENIIKIGTKKLDNLKNATNNNVIFPYSYLLKLWYGNKEQHNAFIEFCYLLLNERLFYKNKTENDADLANPMFINNITNMQSFANTYSDYIHDLDAYVDILNDERFYNILNTNIRLNNKYASIPGWSKIIKIDIQGNVKELDIEKIKKFKDYITQQIDSGLLDNKDIEKYKKIYHDMITVVNNKKMIDNFDELNNKLPKELKDKVTQKEITTTNKRTGKEEKKLKWAIDIPDTGDKEFESSPQNNDERKFDIVFATLFGKHNIKNKQEIINDIISTFQLTPDEWADYSLSDKIYELKEYAKYLNDQTQNKGK